MACQLRRHGCWIDVAHEGAGDGELPVEKMYAEERLKAEILKEAIDKNGEAISR